MSQLYFVVDNAALVFLPGQTVSGALILKLDEPCTAREVKISLKGKAKNHWSFTEQHRVGDTTHTRTKNYDACIDIIDIWARVWGDGHKEKIPPGEHRFPFNFHLPSFCLPSFEGTFGHIRYSLKAEIDRPWKFDKEAELPFTVIVFSDLNLMPQLREPCFHVVCETTGAPLFRRGEVGVEVFLPKRGYVPGESIPVKLSINNDSSRNMKFVELTLREYTDFTAFHTGQCLPPNVPFIETCGHQSKRLRKDVACKHQDIDVKKHSSSSLIVPLKIPPVVISFQCAIIRVYYMLKVRVESSCTFNSTIKLKLPVVIATIPYIQPSPQDIPTPHPLPQPLCAPGFVKDAPEFAPQPASAPTAPPTFDFHTLKPPSYEETVLGATAPDGEELKFAPRVPYYPELSEKWPSSPK